MDDDKTFLALVGCVVLGVWLMSADPEPDVLPDLSPLFPPPIPAPLDPIESELVAAHNAARAERGLKPVSANGPLMQAARVHAEWMAKVDRMEHSGIGDGNHAERCRKAGYPGWKVHENVAGNFPDVPAVMSGWMHSPGHRANIMGSSFVDIGVARARGKSGWYWCGVFGSPAALPQFDRRR